jgi:hypothetical protein
MTIQEILRQHNQSSDKENRIEVRVAINLGEVELKNDDVLGDAVNIAARLEGIAEAGEVYFTEAVALSMNRAEIPSTEIGERTFKGIPFPIRVSRVTGDTKSDQIRKLREGVLVTKGKVSLEGLRMRHSKPRSKFAVAATAAAGLAVMAAMTLKLLAAYSPERHALQEAENMAAHGDPLQALYVLDQTLKRNPFDQELKDEAVSIAENYSADLARKKSPRAAQDWIEQQIKEKPYLSPLVKPSAK